MINELLVFTPGAIEVLIILIVLCVPIALVVVFAKYLSRSSKERQKMRLELGKLADELEQVRKQAEESPKRKPPGDSG